MAAIEGLVFNVQRLCLHDGPGIRTTVFLKGCPLSCQWCDNPESNNPNPEIGISRILCNKCGKCASACPEQAISLSKDGLPLINRRDCTSCGMCVKMCVPEALVVYGQRRTVDEVFEIVRRDSRYFRRSGGGVTVSGGEPLRQSSFVTSLFRLCHESGIHTCIETSGFASSAVVSEVVGITNLFLFDLKHMETEEHRKFTGQPNNIILNNAAKLMQSQARVHFRMPLIPGANDSIENLKATSKFLKEIQGPDASIELMPYHRLGVGKYEALDRMYPLEGLESAGPDFIQSVMHTFEGQGVRCLVSK